MPEVKVITRNKVESSKALGDLCSVNYSGTILSGIQVTGKNYWVFHMNFTSDKSRNVYELINMVKL